MQWAYLVALLLSIAGVALLDRRFRLAFWYDRNRTFLTLALGLLVFIAWDLMAIGLGIFIHGNSPYSLPFTLVPHFPVEEVFFLFLLCYCTLALYRGAQKL
jgi:lycopene cyclase domain-containing protein